MERERRHDESVAEPTAREERGADRQFGRLAGAARDAEQSQTHQEARDHEGTEADDGESAQADLHDAHRFVAGRS